MSDDRPTLEVCLLLYPSAQMSAVHGLTDLFAFADSLTGKRLGVSSPLIRLTHVEIDSDGVANRTFDTTPDLHTRPAIVIVPPCHSIPAPSRQIQVLASWLRERATEGATLASVCGGAFLLAESGILDGLTATTHWVFAEEMLVRFPAVLTNVDRLIVDHGHVLTAGGLMAWPDLGLTLVQRLLGPAAMIETARFMMIDPPGREQRFYSAFSPRLKHGDAPVLRVQTRLQADGALGLSVTAMAELAGLEERTFVRRFFKATGLKPTSYQQHLRVERARALLEVTRQPISDIAWAVGYYDPASFRRVFVKVTGLTPGAYRKRFAPQLA